MTKNDRIIGGVILAIAIYMVYYSFTADFKQFGDDPGPTFLPLIIGIGLAICSIGLLFWPLQNEKEEDLSKPVEIDENGNEPDPKEKEKRPLYIRAIVVAISSVVYVLLLENVGFIISTLVFMVFMIWYLAENRKKSLIFSAVVTSVIVTFSIHFIFENYLSIFLP